MICAPALLYLVISIFAIIYMILAHYDASSILLKSLFILLWTWLLNLICVKGFEVLSWILVLLPYIIFILVIFLIYHHVSKIKN